MITKAIDQTRFQPRRNRPGVLAIGLGFGLLSLGLSPMPGTGTEARAARINAAPTNAPLKYPTYLDNQGQVLSGSSTTHSLAAKDKSRAAYVAFKLEDGAAISRSIPFMKTKSPVGSDARQAITAVTSGAGKIAVKTQRGLFLVNNYRPKLATASHKAAVKQKVAVPKNTVKSLKASTSHVAVKVKAQNLSNGSKKAAQNISGAKSSPAANNIVNNQLNVATAKANPESSPTVSSLPLDSPKPNATADNGETVPPALQITNPSTSAGLTLAPTGHLEAPVPEPGTIAFASLAIGGAILGKGLRRRKAACAR